MFLLLISLFPQNWYLCRLHNTQINHVKY